MKPENALENMKRLIEDGNLKDAFDIVRSLDEIGYCDPEYINAKAILLFAMGKPEDAVDTLFDGLSRNPEYADLYYNLGYIYFESEFFVESALCFAAFCRYAADSVQDKKEIIEEIESKMKQISKLYVVFDSFRSATSQDFILITEKPFGEDTAFMLFTFILRQWDNRIFYLAEHVEVNVEVSPELGDILTIIFENMEDKDGIHLIRPVMLRSEKYKFDTTPYIIQKITDEFSPRRHCDVICRSKVLGTIEDADTLEGTGNRFETVFAPTNHEVEDVLSHGLFGDFHHTLTKLYNVNISNNRTAPSLLMSIVIPTRNNAETLEHTLKTCLYDQGDDFEIVISDNSSPDNEDTLRLVQRLNDRRIKYYRPDRELLLKESFEFAYCKAEGEFIFSIGSDDAVLHRGLETLRNVLKHFPDEDVIIWDRLLYCWPGVSKSQEDQLVIPTCSYQADNVQIGYIDCDDSLQAVINLSVSMYTLPMFYINSGFRRNYIHKVIEKTGKFVDGDSQDIYMGLMNYAINDRLLYIQHPITIAGMSSHSAGIQTTKMLQSSDEEMEYQKKNRQFGTNYQRVYNTKVFPLRGFSDKWLLFNQYAKICQKRINPKFNLNRLNWILAYSSCVESLSATDPSFQERLHEYEVSSTALGDEEFKRWFKETYSENPNFKGATYLNPTEKQYKHGIQNGSLVLDTSLFGVQNVYDACELFYKLFRI
ncbi:glycosyltransferase [Brevibacillus migulae]|uniref:glycosyltransferase n=1 Tax=Brevibacillus migulae TaxID=1644114 RepID=UPI00106E4110|nr:glycosyltransferase [Brevibacillus migulae]